MATVNMHMRACSVDGCRAAWHKRSWCSKHYRAWWAHGDPLFCVKVDNGGKCSVIGCGKRPRSRTAPHCEMHYGRLRRNGTLDTVVAGRARERGDGYVLVPASGHPMALGTSTAYQHRVVFFDAHGPGPHACHVCGELGMLGGQHVDHLNEVRNDNRLENLKAACPDCNRWRGKDRIDAARTSSNVRWIELHGVRLPRSAWAKRVGISPAALAFRLSSGWPVERALTEPRGATGPRA